MQVLFLVALFVPLVLCYDAKYDTIDVDKIIADDKLFDSYTKCLINQGPCTLEHSADFRELIPEVIATACEKCSDIQKKNVRKSAKAMQEKRPDDFKALCEKYDPKGQYLEKFTAFMLETK